MNIRSPSKKAASLALCAAVSFLPIAAQSQSSARDREHRGASSPNGPPSVAAQMQRGDEQSPAARMQQGNLPSAAARIQQERPPTQNPMDQPGQERRGHRGERKHRQ